MAYKSLAHKMMAISAFSRAEKTALMRSGISKREQTGDTPLRDVFINAALDKQYGGTRVGRFKRRLIKSFNVLSDVKKGVPRDIMLADHYGRRLPAAMKFRPDKDVLEAVEKMCRKSQESLLQAMDFARPPFPHTWIEFPHLDKTCGILISEYKEDGDFAGVEVHMFYDGDPKNADAPPRCDLSHGCIITKQGILPPPKMDIVVGNVMRHSNSAGNLLSNMASRQSTRVSYGGIDKALEIKIAVSLLLLLNSRSRILKIAEHPNKNVAADDISKFRDIVFDLSSVSEQYPHLNKEELQALLAEALVIGHFKVRKTGVFWWSAHLRNARDDVEPEDAIADQLGRERLVIIEDGSQPLTLPEQDSLS